MNYFVINNKILKQTPSELLNRKRFRNNLKRKSKVQAENSYRYEVKTRIVFRKIKHIKLNKISKLYKHLHKHFFDNSSCKEKLVAPKVFCLDKNNEESLLFITEVYSSLYSLMANEIDDVEFSFENCEELNLGSLMIINVLTTDFLAWRKKIINIGVSKAFVPFITMKEEMSDHINNLLATMHFPVKFKGNKSIPFPGFRLIEGVAKKNSYIDNSKGKISKKLRKYINNTIQLFGVELSPNGVSLFDNMIGEILANADDHSSIDKWYVYGSLTIHSEEIENPVGELNLIFLNFGPSFFEGFHETRHENENMYDDMLDMYKMVIQDNGLSSTYSLESMITLYGLQEGYSRLLHIDKSRGTGTMTFIRACLDLGMISDKYKSELYLLTGKTLIKCDQKHAPYRDENRYYLSLNAEETLGLPPDASNIVSMKGTFPGTILLTKTFLDKTHLYSKIK